MVRGARRLVLPRARLDEADVDLVGDAHVLAEQRVLELPNVLHHALAAARVALVHRHGGAEEICVVAVLELGLEVRAARLVAVPRALRDDAREHQHVPEVTHELRALIGARRRVGDADVLRAILELVDLRDDLVENVVVPFDGAVAQHDVRELLVEFVGILLAGHGEDAGVSLALALRGLLEDRALHVEGTLVEVLHVRGDGGAGDHAPVDAREQRVGAEPVRAMVAVVHLAGGIEATDAGRLIARRAGDEPTVCRFLEVDPQSAHGIVDGREDPHRVRERILAHELLVDLEDSRELLLEHLPRQVRHVEVDLELVLAALVIEDAATFVEALEEQLTRGDVTRNEVAVAGVLVLEEIVALALRHVLAAALLLRVLGHPDAAALAAHALGDEAQLVGTGDGGGMDLDELAVRVAGALLVDGARGGARVDDRVRRFPEDDAASAGGKTHRLAGEGLNLHGLEVLRDDAARDVALVEHEPEEVPELPLADHPLALDGDAVLVLDLDGLVATHLLVERVEQLLAGGGAGERGAMEERAAEAAEVEQAFGRAIERHAHAVEHVDDARRGVGHALDGRLVREKVAAVDRLFEMDLGGVTLALGVHARVDPALRADRV